MQTPYLDYIWHTTVGQWSMLTGLISSVSVYCVTNGGQKTAEMLQCRNVTISTKFFTFGGCCAHPRLPIRIQIWQETVNLWSMLKCQISLESVYRGTFQGRRTAIFDIWLLHPARFNDEGQIWWWASADPWSMCYKILGV